jgi:hypothetical protein
MWTKFRDGGGDDDINEVNMWLWKTPQDFYKPENRLLFPDGIKPHKTYYV